MGKLLCNSPAVAETLTSSSPLLPWRDPCSPVNKASVAGPEPDGRGEWDAVTGLEEQQRRNLERIHARGVYWKNPSEGAPVAGMAFRLVHGGGVEADGNCLFTAVRRAMGSKIGARELRLKAVRRFLEDYRSDDGPGKDAIIRHLYSPHLESGWGIHVVQDVKLLAEKADRKLLDAAIKELVDLGLQREAAAETIYKERCIAVNDGHSWAKYMSISGSPEDIYDIITLQYTEGGLLNIDENRDGRAAAFGDDIAIESLATEFKREIYVVQSHGSDAMVDDDNSVFFLPHRPWGEICELPLFLFMKGTGSSTANFVFDWALQVHQSKSQENHHNIDGWYPFHVAYIRLAKTVLAELAIAGNRNDFRTVARLLMARSGGISGGSRTESRHMRPDGNTPIQTGLPRGARRKLRCGIPSGGDRTSGEGVLRLCGLLLARCLWPQTGSCRRNDLLERGKIK
ncbi:hypothetical protein HPP92_011533 [Vanilla planifolia]|uniref:OTU domain-containing protein n=1 Tax=Vanilla planifolia TaxID=51239 RepID=A0A835R321_VANPL|nr:hypothetical protein HPP92_011533 [Vanilla planifolia]